MEFSKNLHRLIAANAPLWAGEAEVFRTYWDWDKRTRETDLKWLAHQCYKEIWGFGLADKNLGLFMGPLKQLEAMFPNIDRTVDRHTVMDMAEAMWAEFAHYVAFADAYDAIRLPGERKMTPFWPTWWKADENLSALRYAHREQHGALGLRACQFTEGGYCTLFSEGTKLAGRGGRDDLIAEACSRVYDDEFGHMLKGVAGLDRENLSQADWEILTKISVEQLKLRIRMRNEQFSFPLSDSRIEAIYRGEIEPLSFDFAAAKLALAA